MSEYQSKHAGPHHVVIVGGGFAGLFAAQKLGRRKHAGHNIRVTLIDRRNFHTFQPLLYQVASGMLTTGDICTPHRVALRQYANVRCLMANVNDLDAEHRIVYHDSGELHYDTLIVATGVMHQYFGHDDWAAYAPGLKTVEHALDIRQRIFYAFEMAELADTEAEQREWLTFVVAGGGPTGVELAGAIGELAHRTMVGDFRSFDPREARVILMEGAEQILPVYDRKLANKAEKMLSELGVEVVTDTMVDDINASGMATKSRDNTQHINSRTVLWAAGVRPSAFGDMLAGKLATERASGGRLPVGPDLSLAEYPNIFVVGDLAACTDRNGVKVPGLAPAAIQQGEYVAKLLQHRQKNKSTPAFAYKDQGTMAVIGRNRAVGQLPRFAIAGFFAWLLWVVIHIYSLIGGERRLRVMVQWIWKYLTRRTGDRLITGRPPNADQRGKQT